MPKLNLPEDSAARVQIRFRESSSGHSGSGAWKVAYADFVTALMALFIVLWLMRFGGGGGEYPRLRRPSAGTFAIPADSHARLVPVRPTPVKVDSICGVAA